MPLSPPSLIVWWVTDFVLADFFPADASSLAVGWRNMVWWKSLPLTIPQASSPGEMVMCPPLESFVHQVMGGLATWGFVLHYGGMQVWHYWGHAGSSGSVLAVALWPVFPLCQVWSYAEKVPGVCRQQLHGAAVAFTTMLPALWFLWETVSWSLMHLSPFYQLQLGSKVMQTHMHHTNKLSCVHMFVHTSI